MFRRLAEYVRKSPVLSGGLTVYALVGVLVLLFVLGVGAGVLRERMNSDESGAQSANATGGDAAMQPRSAQATATGGVTGATGSAATGGAQGDSGGPGSTGSATASAASAAEDIKKASTDPPDEGSAPKDADWLSSNFGPAVAPATVAGFKRASIANSETTVTAVYSSSTDAAVDSIRLVVAKLPKGVGADEATEAMLYGFGDSRIAYPWGGRSLNQAFTTEEHAETYPPALCVVWLTDGYVAQLTAIPRTAGAVEAARAQGLDFVSALPY